MFYFFRFLIVSLFLPCLASAQSALDPKIHFEDLSTAYHASHIDKESYMSKVDSLTSQLLSDGVGFEPDELSALLQTYERIAWSDPEYKYERFCYYLMQLNNARMFGHRGASMYYAEKTNQEYQKYKNEKGWFELGQKLSIYSDHLNHKKIIQSYEDELGSINEIPLLMRQGKVTYRYGMDALPILSTVITSYAAEDNADGVLLSAQLAYSIIEQIQKNYPLPPNQMLQVEFVLCEIRYDVACFEKKYEEAQSILIDLEALRSRYSDVPAGYIDHYLTTWRTELFMHLHLIDSAQFYLEKLEEAPHYSSAQQVALLRHKARLEGLKGNLSKSNEYLQEALRGSDKVQADLVAEMDELMYAHTQAEHDRMLLVKSEESKRQRSKWIIAIATLSVVFIVSLYIVMRRRNKKAMRVIQSLNEAANLQIALMEEARAHAKREEQRRISRDLHDDLASTIIYIRNRILLAMHELGASSLVGNLQEINTLISQVYEKVRNRSHFLYETAQYEDESRFVDYINDMAKAAFPSSAYELEINVDPGCLDGTTFTIQSEIIRLLQEAFTNILKHARARHVRVMLYKEGDLLMLEVEDDGRGFSSRQSVKGIGLKNMDERVRNIGGNLLVMSSAEGAAIRLSIPVV